MRGITVLNETREEIIKALIEAEAHEKYQVTDIDNSKLFMRLYSNLFRYNATRKEYMVYDGKRWLRDTDNLETRNKIKELSEALLIYAVNIGDNAYMQNVCKLSNLRLRENIVKDARDLNYITSNLLDQDDFVLNVQNGTLDLSNKEPVFREHSPEDNISKICNADFNTAATCENWEKFLNEIMQGDVEKIRYLQKICGLALTGDTREEKCFFLYGSTTRNGKSTFCETLLYLLGDYGLTMKPETLAQKDHKDSRNASGDIARLDGCRLLNASEPDKRMLLDSALLKNLTGGDRITARHLHEREFEFKTKFKLLINTNHLPLVTDDTLFSSERVNVITFDRHFEPHEQDKSLKYRLVELDELSGILNWCIDGLRMYREEGLQAPDSVKMATAEYRKQSDKIGCFFEECLIKSENEYTKIGDIYDLYKKWCAEAGRGCEGKQGFIAELKHRNLFVNSATINGKTVKSLVEFVASETPF